MDRLDLNLDSFFHGRTCRILFVVDANSIPDI